MLDGDEYAIALMRVHGERVQTDARLGAGRSLGGQFQAFTFRIEAGKIAEFWFMVEDRYAVDAFWS